MTLIHGHVQPFWFYGPVIILALAPWSAWIVGVAREGRAALETRARKGSASIFLACWVVFPIAFFSLSQSKLPGYVLPSVPPAILLLARGIAVTLEQRRAVRTLGIGTAGTLLAMSVAFLVAPGVESAGVAPGADVVPRLPRMSSTRQPSRARASQARPSMPVRRATHQALASASRGSAAWL